MHYKRGKTKDKKTVNWGSPKEYQVGRSNPNSNPGQKRYECKKGKGRHNFSIVEKDEIHVFKSFAYKGIVEPKYVWHFKTYRCSGCLKKKVWSESTRA